MPNLKIWNMVLHCTSPGCNSWIFQRRIGERQACIQYQSFPMDVALKKKQIKPPWLPMIASPDGFPSMFGSATVSFHVFYLSSHDGFPLSSHDGFPSLLQGSLQLSLGIQWLKSKGCRKYNDLSIDSKWFKPLATSKILPKEFLKKHEQSSDKSNTCIFCLKKNHQIFMEHLGAESEIKIYSYPS